MLSLKLIRALGFATRDDFTKLVKSKNLKDRETLSKAISKYQIDHPKLVEDGEDEDDYHDYYDGGYVDSTNSCCGMAEIAECTNHPEEVMYRTFDAIRSGYRGVVYYSIDKKTRDMCEEIGFETVTKFVNHNTGNTINVCVLNVTE